VFFLNYGERVRSVVQRNFTSTVMLTDPRIYYNWLRVKEILREVLGMSSLHSGSLLLLSDDTYTHTHTHRALCLCSLSMTTWLRLVFSTVRKRGRGRYGTFCYTFQRLLHTMVQVPKISWNCLIKWDESTECRTKNCWMNASGTAHSAQCTYGRCTFLNC
jgi:hypothetical protein